MHFSIRIYLQRFWAVLFCLALGFGACTSLPDDIQNQIKLHQNMVINESACGNAGALIDEQDNLNFVPPISSWKLDACKSTISFPSMVIDLGTEYEISAIHYFDGFDSGLFEVSYGIPFQWTPLISDPMTHFQYWNSNKLKIKTRYIQLKSKDWVMPVEIILEGKQTGELKPTQQLPQSKKPVFGEFLGTNAFVDDPIGLLSPFGSIREYHQLFLWNQYAEGDFRYSPTLQGFNFDPYYLNLKRLGKIVCPALQQSAYWITKKAKIEAIPVRPGMNSEDPKSYTDHSKAIFQYAARYGYGKVEDADIVLSKTQERKSNLKLIRYYENWNEQNKWWEGKESYFSPYTYAAMSSADLDGHKNTMGKDLGLINADPEAKLVTGGLADPLNIDYVKGLKFWCDHNRNGNFLWKAINIHHYSNKDDNKLNRKIGISPEEDHLKENLKVFTKYRDSLLPGTEVWLSEFGYDCKDVSDQKAPAIGNMSNQEVQAIWIVRAYLAASAAGIDKAFQYMIRDGDGVGNYASSGLYFWQKEGEKKVAKLRPAWYYISTLQKVLGKYRFEKETNAGSKDILIYSFQSISFSENKVFALWCPTSIDKKINFKFFLPDSYKNTLLVKLDSNNANGQLKQLVAKNGELSLEISEKPIFIIAKKRANEALDFQQDDQLLKLNPNMIMAESDGSAKNLVDEQNDFGDPDKGLNYLKPKTNWDVPYNIAPPFNIYLDLGKEYLVSKLYLFDGTSNGKISISVGKPNEWEQLGEDHLINYQAWNAHVIEKKTRYIRLTRTIASSGIFELALYVRN